jgi:hypothetical protein
MIRIRTILVCVVAMLAMSALGAGSASAFTALLSHPAIQSVLAAQTKSHVFTVESKTVTCEDVHFTGTTKGLISTLILITPKYNKCTAFGFINSTVHVNGCDYTLHISGVTDINCPSGRLMEILVANGSGCAIHIKPQTGLQSVTFSNEKGKNGRMGVLVTIGIKKIAVSSNGKGIGCPAATATEGEYTGTSLAEGGTGDLLVH